MTKPKEEIKIVDCPTDCEYRDTEHGHCLECGELTQPVMECECEFRKPKEEWVKIADILTGIQNGDDVKFEELNGVERAFIEQETNAIWKIIESLKSLWQQEAEERIKNRIDLYFNGLVSIPAPELTKESLKEFITQNE